MPAKAIPLIVAAVVATGIVIYNHREQIVDLYERGRDKLAQSLHRFADTVGPRQREAPVGYSDYDHTARRRQSFEDRVSREEEAEGFLQPYRSTSHRATGRVQNTPARYRRRYSGAEDSQNSHVIYDLPSGAISLEQVGPTQVTVEKELPPPPLPPRKQSDGQQQNEPAPSESGYGSERTVMISPPIKATKYQPSPLAQAPQQAQPTSTPTEEQREAPSHSTPFVPLAAAVVAGTAGATAVLAPEIFSPTATSPSTLAPVQSPPSVHSSSDSEPDMVPPNPFESTASYMSTQEWINNTSSPSDDSRPSTPNGPSEDGSVAGEIVDIPDVVSDFGTASDGEFDDAASWTELGSQTSENDY